MNPQTLIERLSDPQTRFTKDVSDETNISPLHIARALTELSKKRRKKGLLQLRSALYEWHAKGTIYQPTHSEIIQPVNESLYRLALIADQILKDGEKGINVFADLSTIEPGPVTEFYLKHTGYQPRQSTQQTL